MSSKYTRLSEFVPEEPFRGYYRGVVSSNNKSGRKHVVLYGYGRNNSAIMTYARYLYQLTYWKKGFGLIPSDMEVDHINNDCTDDRLDNYQLLTGAENLAKMRSRRKRTCVVLICPMCKTRIAVELWRTQHKKSDRRPASVIMCSRRCAVNFNIHHTPDDIKTWIRNNQTLYIVNIADNPDVKEPHCEIVEYGSRAMFDFDIRTIPSFATANFNEARYKPVSEKLPVMVELYKEGYDYETIGEMIGTSKESVGAILRKHDIVTGRDEEYRLRLIRVREMVLAGASVEEIQTFLKLTRGATFQYLRQYVPEFDSKATLVQKKIDKIKELLAQKMSIREIARQLNAELSGIYKLIDKYLDNPDTASTPTAIVT